LKDVPCPTLADLPPPPPGKTGWPWTIESRPLPEMMPDGRPWPRISIVTPSYNQGQFIEETIRSVLLQGYPELEYIIIDGGSTDGAVDVIRKYERWLTHWEGKKDRGQAHAINKGFVLSTGEIFNWINSDDLLAEASLARVGAACPKDGAFGGAIEIFGTGRPVTRRLNRNLTLEGLSSMNYEFSQPGLWMSRHLAGTCFPLDESLHYAFDWKMLWELVAAKQTVIECAEICARFRLHRESKTVSSIPRWAGDHENIYEFLLSNEKFESQRRAILRQRALNLARARIVEALEKSRTQTVAVFLRLLTRSPSLILDRVILGSVKRALLLKR
jgi:glycosyltransferase involved in cell wall biosynthesis